MIYFWLVLLGVVYVLIAVIVGRVCSMNSRWERTVDGIGAPRSLDRRRPDPAGRSGGSDRFVDPRANPVALSGAERSRTADVGETFLAAGSSRGA